MSRLALILYVLPVVPGARRSKDNGQSKHIKSAFTNLGVQFVYLMRLLKPKCTLCDSVMKALVYDPTRSLRLPALFLLLTSPCLPASGDCPVRSGRKEHT